MKTRLHSFLGRREDSLAVQSIILTAARVASFAITFGIPIVLVRVFDQTAFGVYKQLFLLLGTAIPILNLGMYASLFYFVPRDEGKGQRYIIQAIGLLTLTGALGALAVLIGADQIGSALGEGAIRSYLPLLALIILISTPADLVISVPVVHRRPRLAALTMAGNDLLRAAAIIVTALIARSLTAVLWAVVVAAAVRCLWLLIYVSLRQTDKGSPPSLADLKQQLAYSLPFAAAVLFQIGHAQFHQYYVAAEVSSAQFAIYAVGILQVPIVGMLTQSVVEVMLVRMTAAYEKKEFDEMRRVWHSALARLGVLLIPCWVLAQVFAADIIVLLFGEPYVGAVPVFRVFATTVLLMMIVDHSVLRSTGDTAFVFWANVAGFLVGVPAVVLLARAWGLPGAVGGYLVGLTVTRVMGLVKAAHRLQLGPSSVLPIPAFAQTLLASVVAGGLSAASWFMPGTALRLVVGGLIFSVAYSLMVLRWEIVPREEVYTLVRRFVSRIPGPARRHEGCSYVRRHGYAA